MVTHGDKSPHSFHFSESKPRGVPPEGWGRGYSVSPEMSTGGGYVSKDEGVAFGENGAKVEGDDHRAGGHFCDPEPKDIS